MKELALLMFFIGCGYALNSLANRFSGKKNRRLYFYIPSAASFNIIWGFIFYLGFGILIASHLWLKTALAAILLLLAVYLVRQWLISKFFATHKPACAGRLLARKLIKQSAADIVYNHPYTRSEALRLLGLPASQKDLDNKISARLSLIENLPFSENNAQSRDLLLASLRQALSEK